PTTSPASTTPPNSYRKSSTASPKPPPPAPTPPPGATDFPPRPIPPSSLEFSTFRRSRHLRHVERSRPHLRHPERSRPHLGHPERSRSTSVIPSEAAPPRSSRAKQTGFAKRILFAESRDLGLLIASC